LLLLKLRLHLLPFNVPCAHRAKTVLLRSVAQIVEKFEKMKL
jgi:hypothetical protein